MEKVDELVSSRGIGAILEDHNEVSKLEQQLAAIKAQLDRLSEAGRHAEWEAADLVQKYTAGTARLESLKQAAKKQKTASTSDLKRPTLKAHGCREQSFNSAIARGVASSMAADAQKKKHVDWRDQLVDSGDMVWETVTNDDGSQTTQQVWRSGPMLPRHAVFDNVTGEKHAADEDRLGFDDIKAHGLVDKRGTTDFDSKASDNDAFKASCPHDYQSQLKDMGCCLGSGCLCFQQLSEADRIKKPFMAASNVMPAATHALKLLIDKLTSRLKHDDPFCVALREGSDPIEKIFKDHYVGWSELTRSDARRQDFFEKLHSAIAETASLTAMPSRWYNEQFSLCESYTNKCGTRQGSRPQSCLTKTLDSVSKNNAKSAYGLKVADKLIPVFHRTDKHKKVQLDYSSGKDEEGIWYSVFNLFTLMVAALEHADQAYAKLKDPEWRHERQACRDRIDKYKNSLANFKVVVNFTIAQNRDRIKLYKQSYIFATELMQHCDFCPIRDADDKMHKTHRISVVERLHSYAANAVSLMCDEYFYRRLNVGYGTDTALRFNPFNPAASDLESMKAKYRAEKGKEKADTTSMFNELGIFEKSSTEIQYVDEAAIGAARLSNLSSFLTQVVRRYFGASAAKVAWMAIVVQSQLMTQYYPEHASHVNDRGRTAPKVLEPEHRRFWDVKQVHEWLALFVITTAGSPQRVPNKDSRSSRGGKAVPFAVYGDKKYWRQFDRETRLAFKETSWVSTVLGQLGPAFSDPAFEAFNKMSAPEKYAWLLQKDPNNKYKIVAGPRLAVENPSSASSAQSQPDRSLDQQKETIAAIACMMPPELAQFYEHHDRSQRVQLWCASYDLLGWFATQRGGAPVRFLDPVMDNHQKHGPMVVQKCTDLHPRQGPQALNRESFPDPLYANWKPLSADSVVAAMPLTIGTIRVVREIKPLCADELKGNVVRAIKTLELELSMLTPMAASLATTIANAPTFDTIASGFDLPEMQTLLTIETKRDIAKAEMYLRRIVHDFAGCDTVYQLVVPEGHNALAVYRDRVGAALKLSVDKANVFFSSVTVADATKPVAFVESNWDAFVESMRVFDSLHTSGIKLPVHDASGRQIQHKVWQCSLNSRFNDLVSRFISVLDADPSRNLPTIIKTMANEISRRQSGTAVKHRRQAAEMPQAIKTVIMKEVDELEAEHEDEREGLMKALRTKRQKRADEREEASVKRAKAMARARESGMPSPPLELQEEAQPEPAAGPSTSADADDIGVVNGDDAASADGCDSEDDEDMDVDDSSPDIITTFKKVTSAAVVAVMEKNLPTFDAFTVDMDDDDSDAVGQHKQAVKALTTLVSKELECACWDWPTAMSLDAFKEHHLKKLTTAVVTRLNKQKTPRSRPSLRGDVRLS